MSTEQQQAAPSFQPFQWIDPRGVPNLDAYTVLAFVGMARDIAAGVQTILQMIEADHMEEGLEDTRRILNDYHRGALQRLAIASMNSLSVGADGLIAHAEKCRRAEGSAA